MVLMDAWDEPYGKQSIPGGVRRSKGKLAGKGGNWDETGP